MIFGDERIRLPEDLEKMSDAELEALCGKIRERLIDTVSKNGGHLASNLGVVELTVAMYTKYDPYRDRIVWDVGHQTYVHKILTGRDAGFDSLRQFGGLSGFPKRDESEADSFNTGHSSTSVSAALGMARAAKLTGSAARTVAVIGDGALTGGMAFEALNDATQSKCNITIVLNDNGMSISKNVGGLSRYLGRIRSKHSYVKAKKRVRNLLRRIPAVGEKLEKWVRRVKNSIKFLFVSGEFFEDLGLSYIGPIDGHDIKAIRGAFDRADEYGGPVLIHVITKKGKGYRLAEDEPDIYHGVSPFNAETGETVSEGQTSMSELFAEKLCELAGKDEKICAVTAAMPTGTGLKRFCDKYPTRFFDVGIAEQHAVTMCAGMSVMGAKPVAVIYSTFMQRAYDQLLHDVSLQKLPLVVGLDRAGIAGQDGETHQGIYDFAYLGHMPNVTVAAPASGKELEEMLAVAVSMYEEASIIPKGCFAIRYPAKERLPRDKADDAIRSPVEYGKGEICFDSRKNGMKTADVCIISIGEMLYEALKAAERLSGSGYGVIVFNARFYRPLDRDGILKYVLDSRCVITVEEAVKAGGFGESVEILLAENEVFKPCKVIALPDKAVEHGKISEIQRLYGLDADGIVACSERLIRKLHIETCKDDL